MKILKWQKIILFSVFIFISLALVLPVLAAWPPVAIIPKGCLDKAPTCTSGTDDPKTCCGVNAMLQIFVNIAQLIFALTGSAALLMFAYGGVMFIIAAGSQERVGKAKEILKAAVIGLVIIFGSWLIINFTISALTQGTVTGGKLFGSQDWFKFKTK